MFRSWFALLLLTAAVTQMALFATTILLHRCLTHKAITLKPGVVVFFKTVIWVMTGLVCREWVAVHRLHHAHSDEEGDPHSPLRLGYPAVQFGNAYLYKRTTAKPDLVARYAKDKNLQPGWWDLHLFDHAIIGLGIGIGLLCILLGPIHGLIAAGIHAAAYLLASGAINAIGHKWGKRPYPNFATNVQWLALLVAGEGLHNNHHAMPTAARFAFSRGQIDPGWWLVKMLMKLRWATIRHTPEEISDKLSSAVV